jgi:hypothetical protein
MSPLVPVFELRCEEGNIAKKEELAAIVAEWERAQASAQALIDRLDRGILVWKSGGVDRTDHNIEVLKKIVKSYGKLLDDPAPAKSS